MHRLRTLGRLELLDPAGTAVEHETKPLLLLARLALHDGEPLGRAHFAELLWPDAPPRKARQSLRQALHHLGRLVPDAVVERDGLLATDPARIVVDVRELEAAVARGDHAGVVALAGGPFLRGWARRSGRELAHWIEARGERVLVGVQLALATLVTRALTGGDLAVARRHAEHLVRLNPLSEAARTLQLETLARGGDVGPALMAYQDLN